MAAVAVQGWNVLPQKRTVDSPPPRPTVSKPINMISLGDASNSKAEDFYNFFGQPRPQVLVLEPKEVKTGRINKHLYISRDSISFKGNVFHNMKLDENNIPIKAVLVVARLNVQGENFIPDHLATNVNFVNPKTMSEEGIKTQFLDRFLNSDTGSMYPQVKEWVITRGLSMDNLIKEMKQNSEAELSPKKAALYEQGLVVNALVNYFVEANKVIMNHYTS